MLSLVHKWTTNDLIIEERITQEEIDVLRKWIKKEDDLPKLTNEQLSFLHLSCDRELDFTKKTIKEYLNARKWSPKIFNNRNVELDALKEQLKVVHFGVFPQYTKEGYAILYHKLQDTKFYKYDMEVSFKLLCMTLDRILYEHPAKGLIAVFDMTGVGLMHLTRIRLNHIKQMFHYLQEGLPIMLKAIHVLNIVYFMDKVMAIAKPFMKANIYEMLHMHPPDLNMETFYEKYIPKECLPEDYGGYLPSTNILHEENTAVLREMTEYFEIEEKLRT